MRSGLIRDGATIVRWMSADGVQTELHGPHATQFVMGEGPEGLAGVEVDNLFEAAARQHGETWIGYTMDHQEIDFPLHVLAADSEQLRHRREFIESQFDRFRHGWLLSYSTVKGWRWVAARMGRMTPIVERDPGGRSEVTYEVVLLVESPLAREADSSAVWTNTSGSGRGQLHLFAGRSEWPSWAQFVLRGPGRFRLRWAGNDVTFPLIRADEWVLVNSDEARPTLRARDAQGRERNIWPEMPPGTRIPNPVMGRQVERVDITVTGGSRQSSAWGTVAVQHEGLV